MCDRISLVEGKEVAPLPVTDFLIGRVRMPEKMGEFPADRHVEHLLLKLPEALLQSVYTPRVESIVFAGEEYYKDEFRAGRSIMILCGDYEANQAFIGRAKENIKRAQNSGKTCDELEILWEARASSLSTRVAPVASFRPGGSYFLYEKIFLGSKMAIVTTDEEKIYVAQDRITIDQENEASSQEKIVSAVIQAIATSPVYITKIPEKLIDEIKKSSG